MGEFYLINYCSFRVLSFFCFVEINGRINIKVTFLVYLTGGTDINEGNVFAYNPVTNIFGAVCDDDWTQRNVRKMAEFISITLNVNFVTINWKQVFRLPIHLKCTFGFGLYTDSKTYSKMLFDT